MNWKSCLGFSTLCLFLLLWGFFLYLVIDANTVFMDTCDYDRLPQKDWQRIPSSLQQKMPKVMHQTWKTEDLLPFQRECKESWDPYLKKHGWTHKLWTDAMIEDYVQKHFAWYLPVWQQMHPFIKKVDTFRYMLLYQQGGMYVDLDIEALQPDSLFRVLEVDPSKSPICFIPVQHYPPVWKENTDAASPALIASTPGHPFWLDMLLYIAEHHSLSQVIRATGPIAVANCLRKWKREENMMFLSESKAGLAHWSVLRLNKCCKHRNSTLWGGGAGTGATGENKLSPIPESVSQTIKALRQGLSVNP